MPQTGLNIGPDLAVVLDGDQVFQPGDVIVGRVVRSADLVSPRASVSLRLFGRTKTKVVVRRRTGGQNPRSTTHYYRGRFSLFDVSTRLAESPVHIPPGGQPAEWPFALDIPVKPWPGVATGQSDSFLPLDAQAVASHGLPFTFFCEHNENSSRTLECFVEYVLEATIRYEHGSKTFTASATMPVTIRPAPSPPIADSNLQRISLPGDVRSQRLLPGMENASLSFKEKTAKFFHSSKVPKLVYKIEIGCPGVIQLGSPFPFLVRVIPDREASSESVAKAEHVVQLVSAHFKVKAVSEVLCEGTWSGYNGEAVRRHEFDLAWKQPMGVPFGADAEPLDIGGRMNLCLYPGEVAYNGGSLRFETPIYPSFTTYNIQHSHIFKWHLTIGLASEQFKFEGEQRALILGPPT